MRKSWLNRHCYPQPTDGELLTQGAHRMLSLLTILLLCLAILALSLPENRGTVAPLPAHVVYPLKGEPHA